MSDLFGSVSELILSLNEKQSEGFEELVYRYTGAVFEFAHSTYSVGLEDQEDITNDVFYMLWKAAERGRLANIVNRDEFWALLATMVSRRAAVVKRNQNRFKRGGNHTRIETSLDELLDRKPSAADFASLQEIMLILWERLNESPEYRLTDICELRIKGCTYEEIADNLDISKDTVKRRMKQIRTELEYIDLDLMNSNE